MYLLSVGLNSIFGGYCRDATKKSKGQAIRPLWGWSLFLQHTNAVGCYDRDQRCYSHSMAVRRVARCLLHTSGAHLKRGRCPDAILTYIAKVQSRRKINVRHIIAKTHVGSSIFFQNNDITVEKHRNIFRGGVYAQKPESQENMPSPPMTLQRQDPDRQQTPITPAVLEKRVNYPGTSRRFTEPAL
ncbi:hypothetical protein J5I95_13705 [Candidatus Poribacteria bacterium]|nr:hypothetical protein [Candidatus Poribacteria bacterium]